MGVRFACHECGRRLNVKSELAGRRGICPACSVRFRIPAHDTKTSTPIDASERPDADDSSVATAKSTDATTETPQASQRPRTGAGGQQSNLDAVLGGTSVTWYVRPSSGGQFGPADGPTLAQWISEGRVADTAMLWRDGWPEWRIARSVLAAKTAADQPRVESAAPSPPVKKSTPATALIKAPVHEPSATVGLAVDPDAPLRTGGKVLDTNKKRRSRQRLSISVILSLVFVLLLSALIFVLLTR